MMDRLVVLVARDVWKNGGFGREADAVDKMYIIIDGIVDISNTDYLSWYLSDYQ